MDSETAFWKAKYLEQLMLHTQVIMALSQPGAAALAMQQAGQAARPPAGQPGVSNGAVSPATVQQWGGDLARTLHKPATGATVPMSQREWPEPPAPQVVPTASVDEES